MIKVIKKPKKENRSSFFIISVKVKINLDQLQASLQSVFPQLLKLAVETVYMLVKLKLFPVPYIM